MTDRIRECRIRTGTLIIEAANYLGFPPSFISAMELGRPLVEVPRFVEPRPDFKLPRRHLFKDFDADAVRACFASGPGSAA